MRKFLFLFGIILGGMAVSAPAIADYYNLILAKSTTGAGDVFNLGTTVARTYQCKVEGTGSVSATIYIEVSNDKLVWATGTNALVTFTLTGTTVDSGYAAVPAAKWLYTRANVNAISGTSAKATCVVGG